MELIYGNYMSEQLILPPRKLSPPKLAEVHLPGLPIGPDC